MPQRQLGEYPTLMIRQRRIHTPIFPHSVASESRSDIQNNNSELPPTRENHCEFSHILSQNEENADLDEDKSTASNRSKAKVNEEISANNWFRDISNDKNPSKYSAKPKF
ncbi:hypothetical protein ACTXT7_014214 [Hymenolepis weldensis]